MTEKKNIVLADCVLEEVSSLMATLSYGKKTFFVASHIANWKRTGKFSEIKRYAKYFLVALRYFLRRNQYRIIVGWQQFYALIYCFYCSLLSVPKRNIVIALNFTYKKKNGYLGKIYRWFMVKCVDPRYLDYLHVPSKEYADAFCEEFAFPRERVIVMPFGVNDDYDKLCDLSSPEGYVRDGYALAIGRSNRDYDFLLKAWRGINYPLVIISDTYKGVIDEDNVVLLNNVAGEESYPWIANCGLMVIPIDDGNICSGDTVLLTAMSLGRKILVTAPSTLAQMYIVDGENAVLTEKNVEIFREKVTQILEAREYEQLGIRSRASFLQKYTRSAMGEKLTEMLLRHKNAER